MASRSFLTRFVEWRWAPAVSIVCAALAFVIAAVLFIPRELGGASPGSASSARSKSARTKSERASARARERGTNAEPAVASESEGLSFSLRATPAPPAAPPQSLNDPAVQGFFPTSPTLELPPPLEEPPPPEVPSPAPAATEMSVPEHALAAEPAPAVEPEPAEPAEPAPPPEPAPAEPGGGGDDDEAPGSDVAAPERLEEAEG